MATTSTWKKRLESATGLMLDRTIARLCLGVVVLALLTVVLLSHGARADSNVNRLYQFVEKKADRLGNLHVSCWADIRIPVRDQMRQEVIDRIGKHGARRTLQWITANISQLERFCSR